LKLPLLFSLLLLSPFASDCLIVEDKAYVRESNDVYFLSDIKKIEETIEKVNCMFGGSVFFSKFRKSNQRIKAFLQIKKYLKEKSYKISISNINLLEKKLELNDCVKPSMNKSIDITIRDEIISIEVFLQELFLGVKKERSKRVTNNLMKILNVKYPVFFYE
jgi:hypothetical protein